MRKRKTAEISAAENELCDKIWYGRHQVLREKVESGQLKLIPRSEYRPELNDSTVTDEVWAGALEAGARMERKYGIENLGPYDDFEWGMMNGKLSALRWIYGDEWDMLDT